MAILLECDHYFQTKTLAFGLETNDRDGIARERVRPSRACIVHGKVLRDNLQWMLHSVHGVQRGGRWAATGALEKAIPDQFAVEAALIRESDLLGHEAIEQWTDLGSGFVNLDDDLAGASSPSGSDADQAYDQCQERIAKNNLVSGIHKHLYITSWRRIGRIGYRRTDVLLKTNYVHFVA
jgi:hypothetical protein